MAKAFGDVKMAEKFKSLPLFHQTVQRRIEEMGKQVALTLSDIVQKELLDLRSLHGTTKGSDINVAVKKSVDKFGGFGKCSAVFDRWKEISEFLCHLLSSDTTDLEKVLRSSDFLLQLAFLTAITGYLNKLNLKLQGKDHLVSDLVGYINRFRSTLNLFTPALEKNDLTHVSCCRQLTEVFEDDEALDFSEFSIDIHNIMAEFNTRFRRNEEQYSAF
ncbi:hypothetical protein PR048_010309 [Dryococelus australis]|uniref:Uncharacterized protein n=1 Tax=Dryococelus australis TaxID=614101 RepID=A0ABQ9I3H6_9NEOP|nr:hypothetical protein PR048_010309 [Dryococelus australis]